MSRPLGVRTELVKEFLVEPLADRVEARLGDDLGAETEAALAAAPAEVAGCERAGELSAAAQAVAERLARRGYLARVVEAELFEPARVPAAGLAGRLRDRSVEAATGAPPSATVVAGERARAEPTGKPSPDEASLWDIPGPGGHVRHYVALAAIASALAEAPEGAGAIRAELDERELKRSWAYGFYLRSCEEALPPEPSP